MSKLLLNISFTVKYTTLMPFELTCRMYNY